MSSWEVAYPKGLIIKRKTLKNWNFDSRMTQHIRQITAINYSTEFLEYKTGCQLSVLRQWRAAIAVINCVSLGQNIITSQLLKQYSVSPAENFIRHKVKKEMATTGLRRISVSIRGIINCSSFVKHINVTLAESDSFKLRRILLPQRTAVSQMLFTSKIICMPDNEILLKTIRHHKTKWKC